MTFLFSVHSFLHCLRCHETLAVAAAVHYNCRLQVLTVFFGSFIAGSLLNQINAIIHDPTTVVDILGDAAPQVAVFFMTYLLLMVSPDKL